MSPLTQDKNYVQMFPAIKGYKWAGVVPVQNIDDKLDPKMQYKLLMNLLVLLQKAGINSAEGDQWWYWRSCPQDQPACCRRCS
jgi:hypothetical protein